MTINDERKKEIDFSDPYFDSNQSIAMKAGSTYTTSPQTCKGKKIGVQSGTTGSSGPRRTSSPRRHDRPVQDRDRRASPPCRPATSTRSSTTCRSPPTSSRTRPRASTIVKEIPTGEQYGFGVSKENPELLEAINEAWPKVKASGEYDDDLREVVRRHDVALARFVSRST